jgi:PBP1b-binding outer membrane lipoprotein LpoB
MKKFKFSAIIIIASLFMTSCYSYTTVVGKGAQGTAKTTKWNHYVFWGLTPVELSDSAVMANGAADYTVTTKETFVNGLLSSITFGIYSPTTTTVTK